MRVHHAAVKVLELARAERFYAELLGLSVLRRFAFDDGRPRSVWLSSGEGAFLAVELAESGGRPKADLEAGWHTVAFEMDVAERPLVVARAAALGAEIVRETAYSVFVRDPEGNVVALSHYPAEAAAGPQ